MVDQKELSKNQIFLMIFAITFFKEKQMKKQRKLATCHLKRSTNETVTSAARVLCCERL